MATIGQALTAPESGWKRYDDQDSLIRYQGTWTQNLSYSGAYSSTMKYGTSNGISIKIRFLGTKFRFIGRIYRGYAQNISVAIDGVSYGTFSQDGPSTINQVLNFEAAGLKNDYHDVVISKNHESDAGKLILIDAIDIDDTGSLIDPTIKTKLEDMVIGDKIAVELSLYASSSTIILNRLGAITSTTEIPSTGYPFNGSNQVYKYFHFIYVGNDFKGRKILVADRNVVHTISWDQLNTFGFATKDGVEITSLGLDPAQWKTNIRLLTGGTSDATKANSEWDKYIVNGTGGGQYPAGDDATWHWYGISTWTSTTDSSNSSYRVLRGNATKTQLGNNNTNVTSTTYGFRPVLVAESLAQPIQNKFLIQDREEIKTYKSGGEAKQSLNMTSNTAPSAQVASSSHPYSTNDYAPWKAFDGQIGSSTAIIANSTGWLQIDLGEDKTVNKYKVTLPDSSVLNQINQLPISWILQGSLDGANFVDLHKQEIFSPAHNETKVYNFINTVGYRYYRLNVLATGGGTLTGFSEIELINFTPDGWQVVGITPTTKAMFEQGFEDVSVLTPEALSKLSSATPELLCWTDEAEPARHIKQTVNNWVPVSTEMPTEEMFLEEGMDNFLIPSEAWSFDSDFDVVSYTNKGSLVADINATPKGRLILAETDFSQVEDLTITASGEKTRIILSGDGGASWKAYSDAWNTISPAVEQVAIQGMTVTTFNALTPEQFAELGSELRLGYYIEDSSLVDCIVCTKSPMATETPTLDSIKISFEELTIEGRLKDLEQINAINMAKLQFKANVLMESTKYKLHDLVVDTFEENSMAVISGSGGHQETGMYVGDCVLESEIEELPTGRKQLIVNADHQNCTFEFSLDDGTTWYNTAIGEVKDITTIEGNLLKIRVTLPDNTATITAISYAWA